MFFVANGCLNKCNVETFFVSQSFQKWGFCKTFKNTIRKGWLVEKMFICKRNIEISTFMTLIHDILYLWKTAKLWTNKTRRENSAQWVMWAISKMDLSFNYFWYFGIKFLKHNLSLDFYPLDIAYYVLNWKKCSRFSFVKFPSNLLILLQ